MSMICNFCDVIQDKEDPRTFIVAPNKAVICEHCIANAIIKLRKDAAENAIDLRTHYEGRAPSNSLNSEIAFYAFRYCLGRMTYAVGTCVDFLIGHWQKIDEVDRTLIIKEIKRAILDGHAGMAMDVIQWRRILALELDDGAKQNTPPGILTAGKTAAESTKQGNEYDTNTPKNA